MTWAWDEGVRTSRSAVVVHRERLARFVRDLGIRETARQVGCSPPTIHGLISGRRPGCTPALAERIAEVFGVQSDCFFALQLVDQTERDGRPDRTDSQASA